MDVTKASSVPLVEWKVAITSEEAKGLVSTSVESHASQCELYTYDRKVIMDAIPTAVSLFLVGQF